MRHFHPSDEAARGDWDTLAITGVRRVEKAETPGELASQLEETFRPVAPLLRVFHASGPTPSIDFGTGAKVISWTHHGFGAGESRNIYKSERVTADVPDGRIAAPFKADLGGGIRALVPMAVFVDEKGTLPHTDPNRLEPGSVRYRVEDRGVRLAGVIIAWNVLQHFYPYFDVVQTDWPKALESALKSAAVGTEADYFGTLSRLVAGLKDGHGSVMPARPSSGVPIVWAWIEDRLVVTYVPDAQAQQLSAGDSVVSIDGKPVSAALAEAEALISGATPQWIRWRALRDLGGDSAEKPLALEVEPFRDPNLRRTVTLKRTAGQRITEPRPEKISEIKPGIYYVDLTRINDADWTGSVGRLANASGIVFDLRGYPSLGPTWLTQLTEKSMTSAQWHVPLITEPDHKNLKFVREGEWNLPVSKPYLKAKRAVLTDGSAISYAESTMGIVEYYKLAEIVGSTTAGTNGNVNSIRLPGGYLVSFTGMKVLKQDGSQHHGVGIRPTIAAARTRAGIAEGRDEVLERGILAVQ